ncbi:MAG: FxsA family protein [Magnetococcales bacterium]|nr:FxsA family protein [Magnetococcales bacterium]
MKHIPILLFVILPFVEIWLLIWVGQVIGGWLVLLTMLASVLLGVQMIRHAGTSTLMAARHHLNQGKMPGETLLDGAMRLMGGILLIFPGYLTDLVSLPLALPFTRAPLRRWILTQLKSRVHHSASASPDPASVIIEGELLSHPNHPHASQDPRDPSPSSPDARP